VFLPFVYYAELFKSYQKSLHDKIIGRVSTALYLLIYEMILMFSDFVLGTYINDVLF